MSDLTDEVTIYKTELQQWIQALGLSQFQPSNVELEIILEYTRESLREKSSINLSEEVVILAQYGLFLQQKVNECQTFLRWSNQVTNRLSGNDKIKLDNWIRQAELRLERIQYLARRIEFVGQSIGGLVRARYNERNN